METPILSTDGSFLVVDRDAEFGFQRPEFRTLPLPGTAHVCDRHLFLCYKSPEEWPSQLEKSEVDHLPRILAAAIDARKGEMPKRTRLNIYEGEDGTQSSDGDILIFPDMIKYKNLSTSDVDDFVEEVLVKDAKWMSGTIENLVGSYVYVCSHGSRDQRCGVCGPPLITRFKEEIKSRGLPGQVTVSATTHIGMHKYAGNVIIFSRNDDGDVVGHWYGYVSPDDVPALLDQHIGKREIIPHLWRGKMGLSEEEAKQFHAQLLMNIDHQNKGNVIHEIKASGCSGLGNSGCCQNRVPTEAGEACPKSKISILSKMFGSRDKNTVISVAAVVVSVVVAYGCYKKIK